MAAYCKSRVRTHRRATREVMVGTVGVGGNNPIRIQSMTTTPTEDVEATAKQTIALVEAGCEIVRITAQNKRAARALREISARLRNLGIDVPLVADIHFLPTAAMEAAEHVEKVRINPGNYADRKRFAIREYSDGQYEEELQRLYDDFSPIVRRCKELGRAMRIGTNHGSLSDRIMNRYGDTPLGMVESALEFIRIAESHGYHDIILSMKASNPKIMIEAYRLVVAKMDAEDMKYPLHLGVTEAGDGDDARIKSTIGIGSLLIDGLGDTIRVSLTEDPVYEIPVARELAGKAEELRHRYAQTDVRDDPTEDGIDPYAFNRRVIEPIDLGNACSVASNEPPRVIVPCGEPLDAHRTIVKHICRTHAQLRDSKVEGLLVKIRSLEDLEHLRTLHKAVGSTIRFFVLDLDKSMGPEELTGWPWSKDNGWVILRQLDAANPTALLRWSALCREKGLALALDLPPEYDLSHLRRDRRHFAGVRVIFTLTRSSSGGHAIGRFRLLAEALKQERIAAPLWIRNTRATAISYQDFHSDRLMEASALCGALLCDGIGDFVSVETEPDMLRATAMTYNILQGARARVSKTEYVACPSCGRTLFDLQSTTQQIRARTSHLKGVTLAVMGCIVNGPGEMADADFGYVGGAPGKVNLYVGKTCVQYHIPEAEAVDRLIDLIAEHGKWTEPESARFTVEAQAANPAPEKNSSNAAGRLYTSKR